MTENLFKDFKIFQPSEPEPEPEPETDDLQAPEGMESLQYTEEEENLIYEAEASISGEPELIAQMPTGVDSSQQPQTPNPEDTTPHLTSTVCDVCLELNLTVKSHIERCDHCEQAFCFHFASNIDARYCLNCMSDISITKKIISKEYIHRDDEQKVTSVYRRRAREVKIDGLSWLFAQRKIIELSDVELECQQEYHRNLLILLIDEQERRRNARIHRYAGAKSIITPDITSVSNTTTTVVKKTRTISKNKADEQLAALMNTIAKAKGIDPNMLAALLKGVK